MPPSPSNKTSKPNADPKSLSRPSLLYVGKNLSPSTANATGKTMLGHTHANLAPIVDTKTRPIRNVRLYLLLLVSWRSTDNVEEQLQWKYDVYAGCYLCLSESGLFANFLNRGEDERDGR